MVLFLVFAATLLAAVLLSGLAERTVLSTAVLFLVVGFLVGGVANSLTIRPEDPLTIRLAELALSILNPCSPLPYASLRLLIRSCPRFLKPSSPLADV